MARFCAIVTCKQTCNGRWCDRHRRRIQRRMRWRFAYRHHSRL